MSNAQETINNTLSIVMKSGKASLGFKSTMKALRKGQVKLIITSRNLPMVRRMQLEYYSMLGGVKVDPYFGNNSELGSGCGKFYRISCIGIIEPGDSDILEKKKEDGQAKKTK